jgi:hypothetical protein
MARVHARRRKERERQPGGGSGGGGPAAAPRLERHTARAHRSYARLVLSRLVVGWIWRRR